MLNWVNKSGSVGINLATVLALVWLLACHNVEAQNRINSPYSIFGPGEIRGNQLFQNMSLGGVAQAFRSNVNVNFINPASYTATDSLSFIFDAVAFAHTYQQKHAGFNQVSNYSTLGNLNFSFPVTRFWGLAAGLLPYSQQGYNISDYSMDPVGGRINFNYQGSGGINKVYLGHGFQILPFLSIGVNVSYLFGRTEDKSVVTSDSANFYTSTWSFADEIDGFMFTYGIQLHHELENERFLNIGATFTPSTSLNKNQSNFLISELPGITYPDTLAHTAGGQSTMIIPSRLAAGLFKGLSPSWSVGLDAETQFWSNFEANNNPGNLSDSYMLRLGAIFNPRITTYANFLTRLEYRAGIRYGKSFLNIQDHAINEFGISFGVGIPVRRSLSGINIGFEYSTRGANNPDLMNERFYRVNIGLNIYERWFVRRKFF